jgi:hypothetical protein
MGCIKWEPVSDAKRKGGALLASQCIWSQVWVFFFRADTWIPWTTPALLGIPLDPQRFPWVPELPQADAEDGATMPDLEEDAQPE